MRLLEIPDLHYDPRWRDVSMQCAEAVAKAAQENDVDLIVCPGDLYNKPVYATERGGINDIRQIVRMWAAVCPVVAIEGTPSHDGPGCYGPLEDVGLTLLRPGRTYYLHLDSRQVAELPDPHGANALLFGIPELNKQTIQEQLGLSASEANAEAVNLLRQYIAEYIAPMRAAHPDVSAIGLLHGVVSDAERENSSDVIIRASDIVIHTEDLRPSDLTRWSLGHIHTPWESETICAGYAGYAGLDDNPWGKLGFIPSMNLVDLDTGAITRIPYGTPKRVKLVQPLSSYEPDIAYWLHTDDRAAVEPTGHPWSRVTYAEERAETRRVTREQAEAVQSLRDLYKLIDPDVTERVLEKVDTIAAATKHVQMERRDIKQTYLRVENCMLFGHQTVELDIDSLPSDLVNILGDNGEGKSSMLGFITPYPVLVGKDTDSGRVSAIKDFFPEGDGLIEKRFRVNNVEHKHLITIKGGHTRSPKTECYLYIDGVPALDKTGFDEMLTECERLYGPMMDYLLTSFYVQPLQCKQTVSLMTANMTDIRNVVQSIAGVNREAEKRYALDEKDRAVKTVEHLESWLKAAREFQVDTDAIKTEIVQAESELATAQAKERAEKSTVSASEERHNAAVAMQSANAAEIKRRDADETRHFDLASRIGQKRADIKSWESAAQAVDSNGLKLAQDDKARDKNRERDEIKSRNGNAKATYDTDRRRLESEVANARRSRDSHLQSAETLNKPCPKCGYIANDIEAKITAAKEAAAKAERSLIDAQTELAVLKEPAYKDVPDETPVLSQADRDRLAAAIETGRKSAALIDGAMVSIKEMQAEQAKLSEQTYNIDDTVDETLRVAAEALEAARAIHDEAKQAITQLEFEIKAKREAVTKAEATAAKIKESAAVLSTTTSDRDDWQYIANMLQPAKIPALELDIMLDTVDAEATRILEPYRSARYTYQTETQREGKAGSVDKFDIKIHDSETGLAKSLLKYSPGEKAFLSDAYTKALILLRNERARLSYSPIVLDESDGPIQPEMIAQYYEIQRRHWSEQRVMIVSHSPASHAHLEHRIEMNEVKR